MRNVVLRQSLLVICLLSFLTACDDDDNQKRSAFDGLYSNRWSASAEEGTLKLTYSDSDLYGKEVWFEMASDAKANMILLGIVPGENEVTLSGVDLQTTQSGYNFSGSTTSDKGTTFNYAGSVEKGAMRLDLTSVKMSVNAFSSQGLWYTKGSTLTWTVSTNNVFWPLLVGMGNGLISNLLISVLHDVTFQEDGNVLSHYASLPEDAEIMQFLGGVNYNNRPAGDWNLSPVNLATYYIEDGYMYVRPNVEMIIRQVTKGTRADEGNNLIEMILAVYNQVTQWGSEGIRLKITDGGSIRTLTLEKDQIEPLLPLLSYVSALLPDNILETELAGMGTLGDLLDNILDDVINKTQSFEAGIILSMTK